MAVTKNIQTPASWRAKWLTAEHAAYLLLFIAFSALIFLAPRRYVEDYYTGTMNNVLFSKQLFAGGNPFWSPELILGVPLPLAHNQIFHPGIALFFVMPPLLAINVLYCLHTAIGIVGMNRFCRALGVSKPITFLGVLAFLCSPVVTRCVFETDWLAIYIDITLLPLCFFLLLKLIQGQRPLFAAVALGYCVGLSASAGHLGVLPAYLFGLALFSLIRWQACLRRWPHLALAVAISVACSIGQILPNLEHLAQFDKFSERYLNGFDNFHAGQLFAFVFSTINFDALGLGWNAAVWGQYTFSPYWFTAFGGGFFLACLAAPLFPKTNVFALLLPTVVCSALMVAGDQLFRGTISAAWVFGDTATVTGIALGGLVMTRAIKARGFMRTPINITLAIQSAFLIFAAGQLIAYNASTAAKPVAQRPAFITDLEREPQILRAVRDKLGDGFLRLYYGVEFAKRVDGNQDMMVYGVNKNTPAFYGFGNLVGYPKNIWIGDLYPVLRATHNWVYPQADRLSDQAFLDTLSVDALLVMDGEQTPPSAKEIARFPTRWDRDVVVLQNTSVWPKASFVTEAARQLSLPLISSCAHKEFYCRDLSPIAAVRDQAPAPRIKRNGGKFTLKFESADRPRIIFLPDLYREGWRAAADVGHPHTFPLFGSLIGVEAPAGSSQIVMEFLPAGPVLSALVSWAASFGVLVFMAFHGLRWLSANTNFNKTIKPQAA